MNTTKLSEQLQNLLAQFEQDSGHAIPSVTPLLTLYRDYCAWAQRHGVVAQEVDAFAIKLTRRHGLMPCRFPDGSIGMFGINLKAAMAAGVMQ